MKRWIVVLRLARQSIPEKIEFSRTVVASMKENELFGDPVPVYGVITELTDKLQLAYENSRDAGKEQTAFMHNVAFELDTQLSALGNYVQRIANDNAEEGGAIIYSAGMDVKRNGGSTKRTFSVKNTPYEGKVELITSAEGRASYIWQYSLDKEIWETAKVTLQAKAIASGLKPAKRYYFRVAAVHKEEQGPWQGPINIIVT